MPQLWEVVGGSATGGILVREGRDLKSPEAAARLSTGAVVEELQLVLERLQYRLVTGTGPAEGWISISLKGKPLVQQKEKAAEKEKAEAKATQNVEAEADAELKSEEGGLADSEAAAKAAEARAKAVEAVGPRGCYREYADWFLARAAAGKVTSAGPTSEAAGAKVDKDFDARRKLADANHEQTKAAGCQELPPWKKLTKPELEQAAKKCLKGEMYGLEVPPTLSDLERMGASWLTKAFHAAGTLPRDNAVKKVLDFKRLSCEGRDAAGGAGPKAFLRLEYEKSDPGLHTELFVKLPWAVEGDKELGGDTFYR
eukprot:CAMPEP_0115109382 /NCGR_PEP_ID=MMETSP0227-20121206/38654_1 /TAXON_ID=89957 /ORGANISM="Polarella glacialis, Strain CCMP 1383" /LENGTH=312 /DNA_ID=CAMNT_0002508033 /DNA_START=61 /DNA_END=996 /DNA_ORIENTATION=+